MAILRAIGWIIVSLIVLVIAVAGIGFFWITGGEPDYANVDAPGLAEPVRVVRDADAVPHIFAETENDAYFTLGYLHAQDRLWQMEAQRRIGQGRLAEVVGSFALRFDRLMRTFGFYQSAQNSLAILPDELVSALEAYSAGVNHYIDTTPNGLPPEFRLLFHEPEPWQPADSLVWGKLMALQLSGNYRQEVMRARLEAAIGVDRTNEVLPGADPMEPATVAALQSLNWAALAEMLPPPLGPSSASNEWAVAGERTESGMPLVANDPHLSLDAPALWYLAHIETPTLRLSGATVPGVPMHLVGHNGTIGWGFTTTNSDTQDLFIEKRDPDNPNFYLTPDGRLPFEIREETINVRFGDPETLTILRTRHGPVISGLDDDLAGLVSDDMVVALAFTALTDTDRTPEALYLLNRAQNWDEFLDAMSLYVAPHQNVIYGDTAGNIGFVAPARVPVRRNGDGLRPVPGWTGEYDWVGVLPFEALPLLRNPPEGVIVNANNRVVGDDYRHFLGKTWDLPNRAERIIERLSAELIHDMESMESIALDTLSVGARQMVPLMTAIPPRDASERAVLDLLRDWDYRMDRNRPEPLIFAAWFREFSSAVYADELGQDLGGSLARFNPRRLTHVMEHAPIWCDDVRTSDVEDCTALLSQTFATAMASLTERFGEDVQAWRWGDAHKAPLAHMIFSRIPVFNSWADIGVETDGGQDTIHRGAYWGSSEEVMFPHRHGSGLRVFYDFNDLDQSLFKIATGQSGHPGSPFFGNMAERWRDGDHRTLNASTGTESADSVAVQIFTPQ